MLFQQYEKGSLAGVFVEPSDKDVDKMLRKAKRLAILQSFMALFAILLQYMEYDEFYQASFIRIYDNNGAIINIESKGTDEPPNCTLLRIFMIVTNVLSIFVAYQRMKADLNYQKVKRVVPYREGLFTNRSRARWCVFEFIYLMVFIPPNVNATFNLHELKHEMLISLDMIITFIILTRVIYVLKTYIYVTKWNSWKTMQICRKYLVYQDEKFAGKAQLKSNAYLSIGVLIFIIMGYLGLSLRLPERASMHYSQIDWDYIWNPVWNIIIIMTSVGYGDEYPSSGLGRVFAFGAAMIGSFIISLMVLAMTNSMSFTREESKAFLRIKNRELQDGLQKEAARTLQTLFKLSIYMRKEGKKKRTIIENAYQSRESIASVLGSSNSHVVKPPGSLRNSLLGNILGVNKSFTSKFETDKKLFSVRRHSERVTLAKKPPSIVDINNRHSIASFGVPTIVPALDIIPEIESPLPKKHSNKVSPGKSLKSSPETPVPVTFTFETNEISILKEGSPVESSNPKGGAGFALNPIPKNTRFRASIERHEIIKALRRESSIRKSLSEHGGSPKSFLAGLKPASTKEVQAAHRDISHQFIDLRVQLIKFRDKRALFSGHQVFGATLDLLLGRFEQAYNILMKELRKNSEVVMRIKEKIRRLSEKLDSNKSLSKTVGEKNMQILQNLRHVKFTLEKGTSEADLLFYKPLGIAENYIEKKNSLRLGRQHSLNRDNYLGKHQTSDSPSGAFTFREPNLIKGSKRAKAVDSSSDSSCFAEFYQQKKEFPYALFSPSNSKRLSANSIDGDFYLLNYIPDGQGSPSKKINPLNNLSREFGDFRAGYLLLNSSLDRQKALQTIAQKPKAFTASEEGETKSVSGRKSLAE